MFDIIAILIPLSLAVCLVVAIRIVTEARLRRRLAETHASEELLLALLHADGVNRRASALKWGVVSICTGLGCIAVQLMRLAVDEPAAFGVLFVAAGIGLVAYHGLSRRQSPAG